MGIDFDVGSTGHVPVAHSLSFLICGANYRAKPSNTLSYQKRCGFSNRPKLEHHREIEQNLNIIALTTTHVHRSFELDMTISRSTQRLLVLSVGQDSEICGFILRKKLRDSENVPEWVRTTSLKSQPRAPTPDSGVS